jgi:hypothetical protein
MKYEPVIGLEIHVQLKTQTKMFCSCATHDSALAPNTNVCPICLGNPGALPVTNEQAVRYGILMGLALNCTIADHSKFDRVHFTQTSQRAIKFPSSIYRSPSTALLKSMSQVESAKQLELASRVPIWKKMRQKMSTATTERPMSTSTVVERR